MAGVLPAEQPTNCSRADVKFQILVKTNLVSGPFGRRNWPLIAHRLIFYVGLVPCRVFPFVDSEYGNGRENKHQSTNREG